MALQLEGDFFRMVAVPRVCSFERRRDALEIFKIERRAKLYDLQKREIPSAMQDRCKVADKHALDGGGGKSCEVRFGISHAPVLHRAACSPSQVPRDVFSTVLPMTF